ncbi:MAG: potassium transporter Kup [Gluconobacter potus]|uniref:Probable potassium transport system protein Kup n=1 Tax=Gluconobacter potus TaxID=2724927 RepID=A0A149QRA8_9PROT|nr:MULTISPECIES: potassium transporter Kup [Gluconobacter]KXU99857.1 potassium transporter Kup [Gluconobacter potus]MBF0864153.1 potassium transporter Kup [Gluconobacter sp. R71656]MBF0867965.1 potassium transporter Kup [Gluconobacter sp. R75628]MBF0872890.1 potassium transporter Kup [Gluconobacter sp. R75629]MBF0882136.1 potassium transporter Kup [Gluconobacter potus]
MEPAMPEHDGDHASNPPHGVGIPNDSAGIVQTIEQARSEGHTHEIGGGEEGSGHERPAGMGALLAVLGVVYGDIGTSPLYALQSSVSIVSSPKAPAQPWEIMGLASLTFWALMLIVTIKYVILIMRADHDGEGGIIALMSLAQRVCKSQHFRWLFGLVGIAGTCLFFGDSIITPAISVLSAVEGIETSVPSASHIIIPLAMVVLVGLFSVQVLGTGKIGKAFGPIMVAWFAVLAILGIKGIFLYPHILLALSPTFALEFIIMHGYLSFIALGSVVLSVTGAEALYADMGHFGRAPIRKAWLFFVLPSLTLNYFGQAALLIRDPHALSNPFYLLVPHWAQIPMLVLATFATVIASQAGISGSFSLCRQLIQLGYLPRTRIMHTNASEEAQIYLPSLNWILAFGALVLVLAFRTSSALAAAYGIAVTGTFLCTCVLAMVVFRRVFKWKSATVAIVFGFFFIVDSIFFSANVLKIPDGGWVPLAIGIISTIIMTTWKRGRSLIAARQQADSMPMGSFLARLPQSRTIRVPGLAVFLTANPDIVPNSLLHNLKHNKVLHDHILFVTVENLDQPEAERGHRTIVQELAPNIHRVIVRYGFMEMPNLPRALLELNALGVAFDAIQASYFTSHELVVRSRVPKMQLWRMWIFLLLLRNAASTTEFLRIPPDRVVEFGVRIAI